MCVERKTQTNLNHQPKLGLGWSAHLAALETFELEFYDKRAAAADFADVGSCWWCCY